MPAENLAVQFSKSNRKYFLIPALVILGISFLAFSVYSFKRQEKLSLTVGGSNLLLIHQQLLTGNYETLARVLTSMNLALGWEKSSISNSAGRIVATGLNTQDLHRRILFQDYATCLPIAGLDGVVSGNLCWKDAPLGQALPAITFWLFIITGCTALIVISYRRFQGILIRHATELGQLTAFLDKAELNTASTSASSMESQRLVEAISKYAATRDQLAAVEKEKERGRALAQLAAQVTHDIRSPLTTLKLALSVVTDNQAKTLAEVAVRRIDDIARDLLSHYKVSTNELTQENALAVKPDVVSAINLKQNVEEVVQEKIANLPFGSLINLELKVNLNQNKRTQCDLPKVSRIASNLINNSIESMSGNRGVITVALQDEEEWRELSIKDDGCGIPQELLQKVIQPGGSFGKSDGHGLGLSDAVKTVEGWGGTVRIQSEPKKGTLVTLRLPFIESVHQ